MLRSLTVPVKDTLKTLVRKSGYSIRRLDELDAQIENNLVLAPLPPACEPLLRGDHPDLVNLRQRYAALREHPAAAHSYWTAGFVNNNVDLRNFRGDNAYVWQVRYALRESLLHYFANTLHIERIDNRGLLKRLSEDGAFGCYAFRYEGRDPVSRDLLDSINEMYFLGRHASLFDQPDLRVLDIGAGYGRLAHRMSVALPNLQRYVCVDAVPESTYLSEFYLGYRGISPDRVQVVPLDQIETLAQMPPFHLAVNIHSFTECNYEAIRWWLQLVSRLGVARLFIVPNKGPSGAKHDFNSIESDGRRLDFFGLFREAGYELEVQAPKFSDPHLQTGIRWFADTQYFLFRRVGA